MRSKLPKTVFILGLVSFFNDLSSEMIYPLLPLFLSSTLGAGAVALGVVEGVAESASSILKAVSGIAADRWNKRKPLILSGYGLSGLVRPLIGLAWAWPLVLAARFFDRVGKGLRTSPRDALISMSVKPEMRGRAYGFHRAMDHSGAVAGPLAAAFLLSVLGLGLRHVFLLAAIPAMVVIALIVFGVKDPKDQQPEEDACAPPFSKHDWKRLGPDYRRLLTAVVIFTLGNSTDAFILLKLSAAGVSGAWIAGLWSLHHVVKSIATYWGGLFSDHLGRRRMILVGWLFYAAVYFCFAFASSPGWIVALFLLYGVYYGLTEPCEKAWVADMAPKELCGAAFGFYHAAVGFAALPASLIFGVIWHAWGMAAAFLTGALLAAAASILLPREPRS
ncbi:MFS transporter [Desulfatibacillum aliphaticivorans]|uniref:Major facilitator superfamily MFS_1 n=1 Tax=Desulfatibacillum aliphaticivorans TaxID=218208 RepID=B8FCI3_DESAL|nr:MFS transporter [Desulfatibacillum aliphaticivorans]ACL06146.1 major facilitator superfamily MFS_1 [Desulfatibacillum aliphaticivorans]